MEVKASQILVVAFVEEMRYNHALSEQIVFNDRT